MDLDRNQLIAFARLCVFAAGHGMESRDFQEAYEDADDDVQEAFDMIRPTIESDPDFAL